MADQQGGTTYADAPRRCRLEIRVASGGMGEMWRAGPGNGGRGRGVANGHEKVEAHGNGHGNGEGDQ